MPWLNITPVLQCHCLHLALLLSPIYCKYQKIEHSIEHLSRKLEVLEHSMEHLSRKLRRISVSRVSTFKEISFFKDILTEKTLCEKDVSREKKESSKSKKFLKILRKFKEFLNQLKCFEDSFRNLSLILNYITFLLS